MTDTEKWADEAMRLKNENVDLQAVNAQLLEALEEIERELTEYTEVGPTHLSETLHKIANAAIKAATES